MGAELVYSSLQYNVSDSQALFWYFVVIILRMAGLETLFLCSAGQQVWLCSKFALKFFAKIKALVLVTLFLYKNWNMFMFSAKRRICLFNVLNLTHKTLNHAQSSVEIPISVNTFPSCGINLNLVMVAFNDTHREKFNSAQECNKVNSWQLLIAINQCFTQSIKVL